MLFGTSYCTSYCSSMVIKIQGRFCNLLLLITLSISIKTPIANFPRSSLYLTLFFTFFTKQAKKQLLNPSVNQLLPFCISLCCSKHTITARVHSASLQNMKAQIRQYSTEQNIYLHIREHILVHIKSPRVIK